MTETIIAIWLITSVLSYGALFAFAQREYPCLAKDDYWKDLAFSFIVSLCGPISLLAAILGIYLSSSVISRTKNVFAHGLKFK